MEVKKIFIVLSLIFLSACSTGGGIKIEEISSPSNEAIVDAARSQIGVVTDYDTSYYSDAFPPDHSGACADVIWRVKDGFKEELDHDIANNPSAYNLNGAPDPNIDFRRVRNIQTYLDRHTESLTTDVIPGNKENLKQWQGGDIVTFDQIPGGLWHIAVVSDKRRKDGVPYLIHNYGSGVLESDYLLDWPSPITGHFRF